jgi:3-hydroxybutyryl-CoA dehydrogenase
MKERIAIIGAGLMGHGIAAVFAAGGHPVAITDPSPDVRGSVKSRIVAALRIMENDEAAADSVSPAPTLADAVREADIVVEAAPEKLALKQGLFAELEKAAPSHAILASNTSVIPIGDISAKVTTKHRVLGTHWWNPPYLVPLVEVIEAKETSPEFASRMIGILRRLGKVAVHVKKDIPGFVGNRLQHAMWREAIALVEEGVCDAETVDLVVKNSFGRRLSVLGPLENADLVGTDLTLDIHNSVLPHLNRAERPSPYLETLVREGKLGFKSNQGFKPWTKEKKAALRAAVFGQLQDLNKKLGS